MTSVPSDRGPVNLALSAVVIFHPSMLRRRAKSAFARGLTPDRRLPTGPSPVDSAWHLGFSIGRDGDDAITPDAMAPAESAAFRSGLAAGLAEYHAQWDRMARASAERDASPFGPLN